MKNILAIFILTLTVLLFPASALAQTGVQFKPSSADINDIGGCEGAAANSAVCDDIQSDTNPLYGPDGVLTTVARIFAIIVGLVSVFMIILSGLRYVLSGGDPSKTATARNGILYSSIGIVVAVLAQTIVIFILSKL